jgi:hypothetical protein
MPLLQVPSCKLFIFKDIMASYETRQALSMALRFRVPGDRITLTGILGVADRSPFRRVLHGLAILT